MTQFNRKVALFWSIVLVAVALAYAETLGALPQRWNTSDYLHCYLVVPFALILLYFRRDLVPDRVDHGSWWGIPLLAIGLAMRVFAAFTSDPIFDPMSLLPTLAGAVLLIGGWSVLAYVWPSVVFLVFLIPLPSFLASSLSLPLQRIGTVFSSFLLQTCGIPAIPHGNVITLPAATLNVVEACSGLKMTMLFLAVCTGAALMFRKPFWERIVLFLSAIPIALIANIARLTITGLLYEVSTPKIADRVFHDLAGLIMMPLAILLLYVEMQLIESLVLPQISQSELTDTLIAKRQMARS